MSVTRFADYITVLSESEEELLDLMNGMDSLMSTEYGLKLNQRKTKVMRSSRNDNSEKLNIGIYGNEEDEVKEYYYISSRITNDVRRKEDVKSRLALARRAFLANITLLGYRIVW